MKTVKSNLRLKAIKDENLKKKTKTLHIASHRIGELVGDELPHQGNGGRPLLSNLKRWGKS